MSSAATAGPPPNYPSPHNLDGGRRGALTNGVKQNGDAGKRSERVFRHIRDIVDVKPDVDINAPVRTILSASEKHAKQADSYFDFRRPDLALEEYLKASTIVVDILPHHKDYPELQSDRGELHRIWVGLKKRISSQQDRFDEAKKMIKENNSRNGTEPAAYSINTDPEKDDRIQTYSFDKTADKGRLADSDSALEHNGIGSSLPGIGNSSSKTQPVSTVGPAVDKRPVIHPKPQALQGKSIKPKGAVSLGSEHSVQDLTTRFARLRGADTATQIHSPPSKVTQVQDPRIKTRPIVIPQNSGPIDSSSLNSSPSHSRGGSLSSRPNRPLGPRDLPSAPSRPLKIALGVEIPQMPRPPEAVYSPARNLEDNSHSEIRDQNPHMFNNFIARTSSMDSSQDPGHGRMNTDDSNPYFYSSPVATQAQTHSKKPDFSGLRSITAQQLQQFMRDVSILLVDVRCRDDFDDGHIMWNSIICIEPISLRTDISADDLEQSLVISPDAEQRFYMQRQTYSLVVYYNQSGTSSASSGHGKESSLQYFHKAVYDYSYDKPLQNRPLLLEGGLDAWIDLVGERALATSKSSHAARGRTDEASSKPVLRTRNRIPRIGDGQRSSKEAEYYGKTVAGSGTGRDDSPDDFYFKSADDFLRRFPAVSDIKESMVTHPNQLILTSQVPAIPQKAVTPGAPPNHMYSRYNGSAPAPSFQDLYGNGRTGLYNRHNLCYMNATVQALSSVNELRDYLFRGAWILYNPIQTATLPATSVDEQQLITKTFSNLLMHLWQKRGPDWVNPKTFVATVYRRHLHHLDGDLPGRGSDGVEAYGGNRQLDSALFLQWLLDVIENETKTEKSAPAQQLDDNELDNLPIAETCDRVYSIRSQSRSPIMRLIGHDSITDELCNCGRQIRTDDGALRPLTPLNFPKDQPDNSTVSIMELLDRGRRDMVLDKACRYCNKKNIYRKDTYWVNFPNVLILQVARFGSVDNPNAPEPESGKARAQIPFKVKAPVELIENNLNLTGLRAPDSPGPEPVYDLFAVVCHIGEGLGNGHYTAYKRDLMKADKGWTYTDWYSYNDRIVTPSTFKEINRKDAYMLFYRRNMSNGGAQ